MKPVWDQILTLTERLDLSIAQLERDLNVANGTIQKALKRNSDIKVSLLRTIVRKYNINPTWLLLGTGEMKISEIKPVENVEKLRKSKESAEFDLSRVKHIPIIDIQAAAGFPLEVGNPKFMEQYPVLSIDWPQFKNGEYVMLQVKGDSMANTIYQGDWVICRKLYNPVSDIRDGYIHVIVTNTSEGGEVVCKRVLNRLGTKQHLALQSDNPDFPTYTVPASNLLQIWKVEFKMSAILKNENIDVYERLNNLEGDVAEIRSKLK